MSKISQEANAAYGKIESHWAIERALGFTLVLSPEVNLEVARRLYREFSNGGTIRWNIRKGSKRTYGGNVAPRQRIDYLVHDLSHWLHRRYGKTRPHSAEHACLELRMTERALALLREIRERPVKPEPIKPDTVLTKIQRINARVKSWQTKAKRAANALKKLERQRRYYEKRIAA